MERDPNSMSRAETKEKVMNGTPVDTRTPFNFSEAAKKEFEESTGVQDTPFSNVVHEMQHQYDYDQGKMADSENIPSSAKDPGEIRAVNTENRARKIEGTKKRTKYGEIEIDPKKLD